MSCCCSLYATETVTLPDMQGTDMSPTPQAAFLLFDSNTGSQQFLGFL